MKEVYNENLKPLNKEIKTLDANEKISLRFHLTPIRKVKFNKMTTNKC